MHSSTTISTDDTALKAYGWSSPGAATAIVIVVHGMAEHARRYAPFAEQLAAAGLDVHAFDLRGHGATTAAVDHGHIGNQTRWQTLLDDVSAVRAHAVKTSGDLPVVLFGHSLGSFIAQGVIQTSGCDYAAAVLSGAASPSRIMCRLGALFAAAEGARVDPTGCSALLRALSFGAYERASKRRHGGIRTPFDWLSSRPEAVDAYIDDPETGFDMRTAAWQCLLPGIARTQSAHARRQTPMALPLLFASGADDPVGDFGRAPRALARAYKNNGQNDVSALVYDGARHELINDTTAAEFTHDTLAWLAARGLAHAGAMETVCEAT